MSMLGGKLCTMEEGDETRADSAITRPVPLNLSAGLLARIYNFFSHSKTASAGLSADFNTNRTSPAPDGFVFLS